MTGHASLLPIHGLFCELEHTLLDTTCQLLVTREGDRGAVAVNLSLDFDGKVIGAKRNLSPLRSKVGSKGEIGVIVGFVQTGDDGLVRAISDAGIDGTWSILHKDAVVSTNTVSEGTTWWARGMD